MWVSNTAAFGSHRKNLGNCTIETACRALAPSNRSRRDARVTGLARYGSPDERWGLPIQFTFLG
jgi:hypothetical protein